jgi:hypothetical protein
VTSCLWTLKTRLLAEAGSRVDTWPHACGRIGLASLLRRALVPPRGPMSRLIRTPLPADVVSTWLRAYDREDPPPYQGGLQCRHVALFLWSQKSAYLSRWAPVLTCELSAYSEYRYVTAGPTSCPHAAATCTLCMLTHAGEGGGAGEAY